MLLRIISIPDPATKLTLKQKLALYELRNLLPLTMEVELIQT
jgi:hypothetical protein